MRGAFVHQDDRVDENREIRSGERVRVHRGHGAGKVSAGGKADDSDLLHAPVRSVVAAVAEGVLYVLKRHLTVAVRKAVLHHGTGYSPVVHPFGEVSTFVPDGKSAISAAWAGDDHLPVRMLRQEYVDSGAVGDIVDEAPLGSLLRAFQPVGHFRSFGDGHAVLDDALVHVLPHRVEVDGLCR